jgi:hypothetical protein
MSVCSWALKWESGGKTFSFGRSLPGGSPRTRQHETSPSGKYWSFEPVTGYFNSNQEGIALYSDPSSWPSVWPDKLQDPDDPGWGGSWNGFFGKNHHGARARNLFLLWTITNDEEFNFA